MDQEVTDLVLDIVANARPGTLEQPAWARARELDAFHARREELHARRQKGDITDALFLRRSAVLEEILQDLLKEKEAWEAVEASFSDEASERLRQWRTRPEAGGYSLHQRRALVAQTLRSVLVFPAGRGRPRRRGEGYLPILNASLVISPSGEPAQVVRSARAVSMARWKVG
ncbi:hypothetical protein [Actinomadura latina]|uniref:Uncharacterized protein n=1 Tax=Actinomadura latina TaxID=163603 RepID=A0A846Z3B0_9ACTN|nr:hypothetical protein [Actinomadura latina]NKZ06367.1 hypothetical protein [Actinomadura latina]